MTLTNDILTKAKITKRRAEDKKNQKKKALLRSAYELFTTIGYHKTTITQIAMRAGVAKGTFYLYFKDKEELRDALIISKSSEVFSRALEELRKQTSIGSMEPVDKLIFLVDYILDLLAKDIALLRYISKNLSWGLFLDSGRFKKKEKDTIHFRDLLLSLLEDDGIPPSRNLDLMIYTVIELINSTCYSVILDGEPVTLSEYKPYLYQTIRTISEKELVPHPAVG